MPPVCGKLLRRARVDVSAIAAEDIGLAVPRGLAAKPQQTKEDDIDPSGRRDFRKSKSRTKRWKVQAVLCRVYFTRARNMSEEASEEIEDAFRISAQPPEERELILEVVS